MLQIALLPLTLALTIAPPPTTPTTGTTAATPPTATPATTVPTVEELQMRVAKFYETLQKKYEKVTSPTPEEVTAMQADVATQADAALEGIDLSALDAEHMMALESLISMSPKGTATMIKVLAEQAKQPTVEGYQAAVRAAMLGANGGSTAPGTANPLTLLDHPSFATGAATAEGGMVFELIADEPKDELVKRAAVIEAFASSFNPNTSIATLRCAENYLKVANKALTPTQAAAARAAVLACISGKLATAEGRDKKSLERLTKVLNGAAARGELIGFAVPSMHYDWVKHADGTTPWTDISQLKGKVVVLDFWATWCGPCVGSFPKIAELRAAYPADKVEIVGMTSIQGSVAHQKRESVDCKGDTEKEKTELLAFMNDMGVTWTVAITEEDVFNSDFGIRGIPFVAILDTDGKVYKVGMHPSNEEEIRKTIDELLAKNSKSANAG